jgi:hypothetical protein
VKEEGVMRGEQRGWFPPLSYCDQCCCGYTPRRMTAGSRGRWLRGRSDPFSTGAFQFLHLLTSTSYFLICFVDNSHPDRCHVVLNKENVVCIHNGILFNLKKEEVLPNVTTYRTLCSVKQYK